MSFLLGAAAETDSAAASPGIQRRQGVDIVRGHHDSARERPRPREFVDRFTEPFVRFLKIEAAAGVALFFATSAALVLANSAWSGSFLGIWEVEVGFRYGSFDVTRSLRHWINDGLMTILFFVVALELKRELVLGELRSA